MFHVSSSHVISRRIVSQHVLSRGAWCISYARYTRRLACRAPRIAYSASWSRTVYHVSSIEYRAHRISYRA
eukprot:11227787-Lingulodinium_polyedra.AAC.1